MALAGAIGKGTELLAQLGDVTVELTFGNFSFVDVVVHMFPVIFESFLANLAVVNF